MAVLAPLFRAMRRDESLGLALALVGHAALLGWLAWQRAPAPLPLPERMIVTISDEAGLTAAAPAQAAPAPDTGPVVAEAVPPPLSEAVAKLEPLAPRPLPAPATRSANPQQAAAKPSTNAAPQQKPVKPGKPGATAFDAAFNSGIPQAKPGGTAQTQAAPITGAVRNSLAGAVARELKPRWHGPSGLDVDKLATTVEWDLDPDGSLASAPRVLSQGGITDANRAQAERHKEQALKAVRTAAPFTLPPQYYSAWRRLRFTFDWKINQ